LLFDRIRNERNHSNSNSDGNHSRNPLPSNVLNQNSLSSQLSTVSSDREAFSRWRDRQYYGPRRWISKDEFQIDKDSGINFIVHKLCGRGISLYILETKKKDVSSASPIWISDELQSWKNKKTLKFKKIAALYSEFIAISECGVLHQWKWADVDPFKSEVCTVIQKPSDYLFHLYI